MACYDPVTHVIFDLDGTLVDTEGVFTTLYGSVLKTFGKELDEWNRALFMGRPAAQAIDLIIRQYKLPTTVDEFQEIAKKEFSEQTNQRLLECKLKPGVERLLMHLYNNEIPLAIATSSKKETYELKTRNHKDLFSVFHHSVNSPNDEEVENGKPAPDIFLVCASRFKDRPPPDKVLVFEDSPSGVEAAVAAGMQVVMIPDPIVDVELRQNATMVLETLENFQPELFGLPPFSKNQ